MDINLKKSAENLQFTIAGGGVWMSVFKHPTNNTDVPDVIRVIDEYNFSTVFDIRRKPPFEWEVRPAIAAPETMRLTGYAHDFNLAVKAALAELDRIYGVRVVLA